VSIINENLLKEIEQLKMTETNLAIKPPLANRREAGKLDLLPSNKSSKSRNASIAQPAQRVREAPTAAKKGRTNGFAGCPRSLNEFTK
jgi:hypothetical protein